MQIDPEPPIVRFGIIGVGAANSEVQAIDRHPHLTVTAAADRNPQALERFRSGRDVEGYLAVKDLCRSPNVDAVYIGTPTQFHPEHALMALEGGKHTILAKPMALNLDQADRMVTTAERHGLHLMVGHTQAFEPAVLHLRQVIHSGELGPLRMINTWYYTDWIYRGRVPEELDTTQGGGVVYRQGAHQFDIVRLLGGGLVRSVRATTGVWDRSRPAEGAYAAFLTFEDGAVATAVFNGYDHFHSVELGFGIGEGGARVTSHTHASARKALDQAGAEGEPELKRARRSGEARGRSADRERYHSFYGLTIVSCENGDIRQSPDGLLLYGDDEQTEITIPREATGREVMVDELYRAIVEDRPPPHDGRWGLATLEVQLAVVQSAREQREVTLSRQVRWREE